MKKSRFSKNHLSALWTNVWVFSSRNARIRRTLAAKLEISQNFDGNRWKFLSQKSEKCEKCKNFEFFFYSENKYFDAGSKISVPRGQYWKKNVKNRQLPSLKHLKNVKKFQKFCIVWRCIEKMTPLIFWFTLVISRSGFLFQKAFFKTDQKNAPVHVLPRDAQRKHIRGHIQKKIHKFHGKSWKLHNFAIKITQGVLP